MSITVAYTIATIAFLIGLFFGRAVGWREGYERGKIIKMGELQAAKRESFNEGYDLAYRAEHKPFTQRPYSEP